MLNELFSHFARLMAQGKNLSHLLIAGLIIMSAGCVEPYDAPDDSDDLSILVVDGFVDASRGSATVRLSHTVKLNSEEGSRGEKGAMVTVRSETGESFVLTEQDSGRYFVEGLAINPLLKYQLEVKTSDGEEYISDPITITDTPPIDSIAWRPQNDGLVVHVNTHDVTGNSRYYRWNYVETWEYHAPFAALYKVVNQRVIYRQPDEFVFECYRTVLSKNILIGSSARLDQDVIRDFPLVYIPRVSNRISVMYSINVRQRVIEKAEYEFWEDLQRVTENLGSLFDSQPYEIVGNIHHVSNPSTPVLGYFSGGMFTEKRIFIDYLTLPNELQIRPYNSCLLDTVCIVRTPTTTHGCSIDLPNLPLDSYIVDGITEEGIVWGFTMASSECADCRVSGGILTKPDFWP